jgi:hypothetical protein
MLLTKTFLVAAAIAGGLLASPSAAAAPRRIPQPPPLPTPWAQHCKGTVVPVRAGSSDRLSSAISTASASNARDPWSIPRASLGGRSHGRQQTRRRDSARHKLILRGRGT